MITFFVSIAVLLFGFIVYGKFTEKVFNPDGRKTPAVALNDGVDHVPMKTWKATLIQFLNIAGTGPIFGALMGACFGPVVFLWIVMGSILAGAVHDYTTGMISERHNGASIAELSGIYFGRPVRLIMRIFAIVLLLLVGTVFIKSSATLMSTVTGDTPGIFFWILIISVYCLLATLLPIDKVIGKAYPVFGVILIIMAVSVTIGIIITPGVSIPELTLENLHPDNLPIWPFMFVTVACGAISGFHSTQSPIMAKCIKNEKDGRPVFYGAMIIEAVIALIWAAAGVAFYGGTHALINAIDTLGQSGVVFDISNKMLGVVGGILAIVGVVICPITSADTAFRSARLIIAEWTKSDQKKIKNRLLITVPLLVGSWILTNVDFDILWRYFSWSNQTIAMIALWVSTSYFVRNGRKAASLITALPAAFMTGVSITYILMATEGFGLSATIAYPVGLAVAAHSLLVYSIITVKIKAPHKV